MYEGLPEDDSLLPRGSRRRDVSALKRGPQHATAADDGEEGDPCDGGGPDRSRAKQPPVISIAQKAMAVVFVVTCCYLLASSGLRDDARAHTPPKFSAYVSGKPDSLEGALGALFALQAPAAGSCAVGVSRVACQLDASAALALSLEHRAHALGALMPCWALFRLPQHAGAQRVVVLRGGLRLGGGAFAPALLDAMGADVLLPSSRAPPGGASAYLQPDPCAAHYVRKGPPRSGWPLQGAPAVDLAAVDQREASLLPPTLLGPEADNSPGKHHVNISGTLLARLVASAGDVRYTLSTGDVPAIAELLAPAADDAFQLGPDGKAVRPDEKFMRLEDMKGWGEGNLSLAIGLLEPDEGLGIARARLLRTMTRKTLGEGAHVHVATLKGAPSQIQAKFVRAHGLLVVNHGEGAEALLYVQPCTAVLELYPDYHFRPGLYLPLLVAAGGLAFVGTLQSRPEVSTWERLVDIGPSRAEEVLRPPSISASAIAAFLPTMVAAREDCLARHSTGGRG